MTRTGGMGKESTTRKMVAMTLATTTSATLLRVGKTRITALRVVRTTARTRTTVTVIRTEIRIETHATTRGEIPVIRTGGLASTMTMRRTGKSFLVFVVLSPSHCPCICPVYHH